MEENRDTFQNEIDIGYQIDRKEEKGNVLNNSWSSLSKSCLARVIRRFIPLILAVWHQVDIGLDVNQSITYYQMSYDNNSLYQSWAQKHKNETNETMASMICFFILKKATVNSKQLGYTIIRFIDGIIFYFRY